MPGSESNWDGFVVRYELTAPIAEAELAGVIATVDAALSPADETAIVTELGRLRALTVSREAGQDLSLTFAAYTDELLRYPGDAVKTVLREWPRSNRFWPSLAELTERLERLTIPRRALLAALHRGYQSPPAEPKTRLPTAAEKAAVAELLAAEGIIAARRERPLEAEPFTATHRRRVLDETRHFRLPDADDPRVQARLREMAAG